MDKLTPEQRRKCMQAVRSVNTSPEILLRKALWRAGFRYRLHSAKLAGKPDIVLPKYKIVIFCDGAFWHGYNWEAKKQTIQTNREYWIPKIERTMQRDKTNTRLLKKAGWAVLRFWDFEIKKELDKCLKRVLRAVKRRNTGLKLKYRF